MNSIITTRGTWMEFGKVRGSECYSSSRVESQKWKNKNVSLLHTGGASTGIWTQTIFGYY